MQISLKHPLLARAKVEGQMLTCTSQSLSRFPALSELAEVNSCVCASCKGMLRTALSTEDEALRLQTKAPINKLTQLAANTRCFYARPPLHSP